MAHMGHYAMEAEESLQQPAAAVTEPRIETALDVSPQPLLAQILNVSLTVIPAEEFAGLLLLPEHPPRSEMGEDVFLERHQLQEPAPLTATALAG